LLSALAIGVVAAGCLGAREDPSRFFLLTAPDAGAGGSTVTTGPGTVAVGPLELPSYLSGPMLVTRVDDNEVDVSEYERWAEPLDDNMARVIAENLAAALGSRVTVFPALLSEHVRFRVPITVTRFDRDASGQVELWARWRVDDTETGETLEYRDSRISQSAVGASDSSGVRAMSGALTSFSQEIAATIRGLPAP
jgi:uncharacterized lipoprotein YmbA